MISSKIHMEYLKPEYWTNLGIVLSCLNPDKEILHILKMDTGKFKGVTSGHKKMALDEFILSGRIDIEKIFSEYEKIEEIRVYTLEGLQRFYTKVQESSVYQMDIDEYMNYLYQMQEKTEGIQVYSRSGNNRYYMEYLKFLLSPGEETKAFVLWLTRNGKPYFNCILEFRKGKMVRITTSDRYPDVYGNYSEVCLRVKTEYPNSTKCVTMDIKDFERKMKDFYQQQKQV